jgi:hypothetical protein
VKDWVVLIACGLIGWGVVSWLISVIRPPRQPSVKDAEQVPLRLTSQTRPDAEVAPPTSATTASDSATAAASDPATSTTGEALSAGAMETAWPTILQVDKSATAAEIEKAYHALLAECDRIRFSTWYSAQERQEAETRRAKVCAAYEFIRPRR